MPVPNCNPVYDSSPQNHPAIAENKVGKPTQLVEDNYLRTYTMAESLVVAGWKHSTFQRAKATKARIRNILYEPHYVGKPSFHLAGHSRITFRNGLEISTISLGAEWVTARVINRAVTSSKS